MKLHLTKFGQGRAVVFFHGWGFDSTVWLSLVPYLSASHQVILVDLPGFGQSDPMDWQDFKHLLCQDLPKPFALVGWSMGGLYASRLATEVPDCRCLVNVSASPCFLAKEDWPGVSAKVLNRFHQRLSADVLATLTEFIALQRGEQSFDFQGVLPSKAGLEAGLASLTHWDLRESIKSLQTRACFLFGKLDPITPIKTMTKMETLYPKFHYRRFNQSAHMPFLSEQEAFIEELLGFIQ